VTLELLERAGSGTDRPLRDCIAAIGPATLEVSDQDLLFNVNTPDDLLQAAAMLDARSPRHHPALGRPDRGAR
jgi:molybdopterin-guanine dinucleotide biosynthesis protein A